MRGIAVFMLCFVVLATSAMSVPRKEDDVAIYVPDKEEIVYDFANRLVVYRFVEEDTGEMGPCYARAMEEGETYVAKPKRITEGILDEWQVTTRKVPEDLISKQVDKMCKNTDVFWLEKYGAGAIAKRAVIVCVEWKVTFTCRINDVEVQVCVKTKVCVRWG